MLRIQIDECGCFVETLFMKIDRTVFILLLLHTGFLAAKTQEDSRLQFHQVPSPLSMAAVVEDWPRFNGVQGRTHFVVGSGKGGWLLVACSKKWNFGFVSPSGR